LADIGAYFERLASLVGTLQGMAEYERAGTPFTTEQMESSIMRLLGIQVARVQRG